MKFATLISSILLLTQCFSFGQEFDLRKPLSEAAFNKFHAMMMGEAEHDPQAVGRQTKEMLIGMLGLENKKEVWPALDASVGYNVATVILLVANNSQVKSTDAAIEQYQKEAKMTASDLKSKPELAFFIENLTSMLILANRAL